MLTLEEVTEVLKVKELLDEYIEAVSDDNYEEMARIITNLIRGLKKMIGVGDCLEALRKIVIHVKNSEKVDDYEIRSILVGLKRQLDEKEEIGFPAEVAEIYSELKFMFR